MEFRSSVDRCGFSTQLLYGILLLTSVGTLLYFPTVVGDVSLLDMMVMLMFISVLFRLGCGEDVIVSRWSLVPYLIVLVHTYFALQIVLPVWGFWINQLSYHVLSYSLRFLVFYGFWLGLRMSGISGRRMLSILDSTLLIGVVVNGVYAGLQYLEFLNVIPFGTLPHHRLADFLTDVTFEDYFRVSGLFRRHNTLGWFGLFGAFHFCVRLLERYRNRTLFGLLWAALCVVLPNSRTAIVLMATILPGLVFVHIIRTRSLRRWQIILFALSGGVLVFPMIAADLVAPVFPQITRFARLFSVVTGNAYIDTSLMSRVGGTWPSGMEVFFTHPWGYGAEPALAAGTIDSGWITYLSQGSMVMVIAFAFLLMGILHLGIKSYLQSEVMGLTLVAQSLAITIGSVFLHPITQPPTLPLFLVTVTGVGMGVRIHE